MSTTLTKSDPELYNFAVEHVQKYFGARPEQAEVMINFCELRRFEKKSVLTQEGGMEDYLNMVLIGLVRKYFKKGKNDVTLQLATEGHIIHSEISFLQRKPSPVVIETIEPTVLLSLHYSNYLLALENLPGADKMGRLLLTGMLVKKDERHFKQLHLTTRERFLEYMSEHPHMLQRVPQKYLASYLNIKPETFSRLKHLVKLR